MSVVDSRLWSFALTLTLMVSTSTKALADAPVVRTMRVTILGPDEKPLAGVRVRAEVQTRIPFERHRVYVCDDQGQATVELPMQISYLEMLVRHHAHVGLPARWMHGSKQLPRDIPAELTVHLEKGTVIGGTVKDEDGEPIAGARVDVRLMLPENRLDIERLSSIVDFGLAEGEEALTTDAQGRWSLGAMPEGAEFDVQVLLSHPDYVSDQERRGLQKSQGVDIHAFRVRTATSSCPAVSL